MTEPITKMDSSSLSEQQQNQHYSAQAHDPQQNPNYQPNGYPQQLPEPASNYQIGPPQGQGADRDLTQQNPNYAYYQPNGYPQQLPESGSCPESAPNYQSAPAQIGDLGFQMPLGTNPAAAAAVAALSQLVQFAGSMEGAAWLNQGQHGQFTGPSSQPMYMGRGRRGGMPFRGRGPGRGRGRGRTTSPSSSNPNPPADVATETTSVNEPKQEITVPNKPQFRCELCCVDCNSSDILNQHKNGKKHKKNLEKTGQTSSEPAAVTVNTSSETPAEPSDQKRGTKRKMTGGGRNGKKTPKVVIPLICELCNVKCDTQEVYDRHLAGKKHISKFKRYQGHQSMYGPIGLQALYPSMGQTLAQQQGPQEPYIGPQPGPYGPTQAHYAADPLLTGSVPGPSS